MAQWAQCLFVYVDRLDVVPRPANRWRKVATPCSISISLPPAVENTTHNLKSGILGSSEGKFFSHEIYFYFLGRKLSFKYQPVVGSFKLRLLRKIFLNQSI